MSGPRKKKPRAEDSEPPRKTPLSALVDTTWRYTAAGGEGRGETHRVIFDANDEVITISVPFHTPGHSFIGTRALFFDSFSLVV